MGCFCNCLVGIVNCILMSFGLSLLVSGIYLQINGKSDCEKVLTMPLIVLGGLLLAISIIGVLGTSCGSSACMYTYLTLMFMLIIGVIGFTIFVFIITNHTVGEMMFSNTDKPENAWDLPNWLPNKVNNPENWNKIKSCLIDTKVCTTKEYKVDVTFNIMVFFNVHFPDLKLYNKSLPELRAACCMPPIHCGLVRKNETLIYEKTILGATEHLKVDGDCNAWNNDPSRLCFDCNSCKEGVVINIKREWKALAFLNICVISFLLLIYMLGCCAFCF